MKKGINIIQGRIENKVPSLCQFCDKDYEYITDLEKAVTHLTGELNAARKHIEEMQGKCSIRNFYQIAQKGDDKKHFKTLAYQNRWIDLENVDNYLANMQSNTMITITFDPQFFKHIYHKESQKKYLVSLLELMKEDQVIGDYIGCYELQENGRVHVHAKTQFALPAAYEYRRWLTTKGIENQKAIHIMQKENINAYITKVETKDADSLYNYFKNNI